MSTRIAFRACVALSSISIMLFGFLSIGCHHAAEPPPPPTEKPDTTSHSITWIVDSLGAQGLVRDVWTFSRDSAIAVGQIILPDSDGRVTGANVFMGALWNGTKWKLLKLTYPYAGQDFHLVEARGLWASPSGEFWLCASNVWSWDGKSAQAQLKLDRYSLSDPKATVEKLWGTTNSNIFGVGNAGTIVHYDGSRWSPMPSGTTVDLQDVWGLDGSHVWATGYNVGDGHSVLLQFNGSIWSTVYDNANQPPLNYFNFSTVWTYDPSVLYLGGGSRLSLLEHGTYTRVETGGEWVSYRVRGSGQTDLYVTGQGSEVTHFNGVSWHLYGELKALNAGNAWFLSVSPLSGIVIVGGESFSQYNSYPIVIRGYR